MSCQWGWGGQREPLSQPLFPTHSLYFLPAGLMAGGGAAAKSGSEIMNISLQHPHPTPASQGCSAVVCSQEGRMTLAALSSTEGLPSVQPLAFS